jgi:hypothetical protein
VGETLLERAVGAGGIQTSPAENLRVLVRELFDSGLPLNVHSRGALTNSLIVKPTAGYLLGLTANSTNVAAQYILLFDSATVPSNGAIPTTSFTVPLASHLAIYFNTPGRAFQTGICVCNSTTAATLTIGAADTYFDAQFI